MKFRINNVQNRNNTNLINHTSAITAGVNVVFPGCSVSVRNDYFEIIGVKNYNNEDLRNMGKKIVSNDFTLRGLCKTYIYKRSNGKIGKSVQLLKRF